MSEETKTTLAELQKKIEDVQETAEKYRTELEEMIKSKPMASAGIIFAGGIVLGLLIGTAVSRRS